MTGLEPLGEAEVLLTFTFFFCLPQEFELKGVVFAYLGFKERYFIENRAVDLSPLTCS